MLLHFTKMHGLGNDFVVIDLVTQHARIDEQVVRHLADRRFGIGCDQVLLVEPPDNPDMDFKYRVFNADGGEVEQCGNGARCFAIFVREQHLSGKQRILVETAAGPIELIVHHNGSVTVNMGVPVLEPAAVPFNAPARATTYPLEVLQQSLEISAVSMGNPHAVVIVDDVDTAPVATLGPAIENHVRFPRRVNAGFLQILNRQNVKLRVYERGAGETLACGTGACAAVVAGNLRGLLDSRVTVHLPGGALLIEWQGEGQPVMMTGPAVSVFRGKIRL